LPCQNASSSHPSGSRTPSGTRPARQRGPVWRIVRLGAGACFIRYGVRACRRGRNPAPLRSPRLCRCRRCDQRDGDQGTHPTAAVTTVQRSETLSKAAAVGLFASIGGKDMAQYASWVKSWAGSPMTARDGSEWPRQPVRSESQPTNRTGKSLANNGCRLLACNRPGAGPGLCCWFVWAPVGIEPATPSLPWIGGPAAVLCGVFAADDGPSRAKECAQFTSGCKR